MASWGGAGAGAVLRAMPGDVLLAQTQSCRGACLSGSPRRGYEGSLTSTGGRARAGKNKATARDLRLRSRESVVFGDGAGGCRCRLIDAHRKGCVEEMWWEARRSLGTVRKLASATTGRARDNYQRSLICFCCKSCGERGAPLRATVFMPPAAIWTRFGSPRRRGWNPGSH